MAAGDVCPRWLLEMAARDGCPEMAARNGCPRWLSVTAFKEGSVCQCLRFVFFLGSCANSTPKMGPKMKPKNAPTTARAHYRPSRLLASFSWPKVDPILVSRQEVVRPAWFVAGSLMVERSSTCRGFASLCWGLGAVFGTARNSKRSWCDEVFL